MRFSRTHGVRTLAHMLGGGFTATILLLGAASAHAERPLGRSIAEEASGLVGLPSVKLVSRQANDDCSGFVRAVYQRRGLRLPLEGRPGESGVEAIYRAARRARAFHRTSPRPGDLVFFRDTYDRNRDGLRNDGLTHVGIVERVERGGRVAFVHRSRRGIERSRLDLRHPALRRDTAGEVHNDVLRRASAGDRAFLAGELLSGFASPERLRTPSVRGREKPRRRRG